VSPNYRVVPERLRLYLLMMAHAGGTPAFEQAFGDVEKVALTLLGTQRKMACQ